MENQTEGHWSPVDDRTAVHWTVDPDTGEHVPDGLVMYGPITSDRIRALRPRSWSAHDYQAAGEGVPSPEIVALMARRVDEIAAEPDIVDPLQIPARGLIDPDETWAQFYERIADVYTRLSALYPRRPAAVLAERVHPDPVSLDTVRWWIRKAREQGSLPTTDKTKTKGNR